MTAYKYLWFIKWSNESQKRAAKDPEFFTKWMEKHNKHCEKSGVKLVFAGTPYTTVEESVFCYETEMPLAEFQEFKQSLYNLDRTLIDYAKTITVVPY